METAYLFGSVARGEESALSDLDLAILFSADMPVSERFAHAAALVGAAEPATSRRVDLLILNEAAPAIRYRVVCEGSVLYAREGRLGT